MVVLATCVLAVLFLVGDAASRENEAEKWVGPILTSSASLAAALFAYLTARDRLRYDSKSEIREARLLSIEAENKECKEDRKITRERLDRVVANFQAHLFKRPLPYPNEFGGTGALDAAPPRG